MCSQLPNTWLPWGRGRQWGRLCKRGFANRLQRAVGLWACQSPQAPSTAWVGAVQMAAQQRGFCWDLEHHNLTPCLCSLQLCVILEPMQELMSRHKTYSLSPRDCLKTCLFQKWQRMVAPPGESHAARCAACGSPVLPARALPSVQASPSPRAYLWPCLVRLGQWVGQPASLSAGLPSHWGRAGLQAASAPCPGAASCLQKAKQGRKSSLHPLLSPVLAGQ